MYSILSYNRLSVEIFYALVTSICTQTFISTMNLFDKAYSDYEKTLKYKRERIHIHDSSW